MSIASYAPIKRIERQQYEAEKGESKLPLEELQEETDYLARLLLDEDTAGEFYVRIGQIEKNPKRKLLLPRYIGGTKYLAFRPVEFTGFSLLSLYSLAPNRLDLLDERPDPRAVDDTGIIQSKLLDREAGYFNKLIEESRLAAEGINSAIGARR